MKFEKRKLSNGITVLFEKREVPVVSVSISNPFGASHETSKIKGIAHFIEHLLFTGTKNRTHEDISREIEKKGGVLNAFTSNDITSYWFKLPSEHLFAGLDILTDVLNNVTFEKEKFEKEKKVILEEIKMYHDIPQHFIFEKILENLYEKPFGEGIIGSKETLNSMDRDFVASYFSEKYSPENFVVSIVGNADLDKVCKYLEKNFAPKNKTLAPQKIKKKNARSVEERSGIDQAHFVLAVHAPLATTKQHSVLEVLDGYLANGMSSHLFLEIREKRGLAYSVHSSLESEKNYSHYSIYVGTTKLALKEVEELILQGFANIESISSRELEEAKERLIGLRKVSSEESASVMNSLVFEEISSGDAHNYYKYEESIRSVTLDEVKSLAKELIKNYSTAAIVPK